MRAIPGKEEFERTNQYGAVTTFRTVDWIIEAEDLVDGELLTPEAGDEIEHATAKRKTVYQIGPPTETEPAYREIGIDGDWLRIHSQKVE